MANKKKDKIDKVAVTPKKPKEYLRLAIFNSGENYLTEADYLRQLRMGSPFMHGACHLPEEQIFSMTSLDNGGIIKLLLGRDEEVNKLNKEVALLKKVIQEYQDAARAIMEKR